MFSRSMRLQPEINLEYWAIGMHQRVSDHFQNSERNWLSRSFKAYFLNWYRLYITYPSPLSRPCLYSFRALWITVSAYSSSSNLLPSQSSQESLAFFSHWSARWGSRSTRALQAFAWLRQFSLLVTWSSLCSRQRSIMSTDSLRASSASFLLPTAFCMCPQYRQSWQQRRSGGTRLSSRTARACSTWSMASQQLLFSSCFLAILALTLASSIRILSDFLLTVELTWWKKSSQCLMGEWLSSRILKILKQLMLSRLLFDCWMRPLKTTMSCPRWKASFSASRSASPVEKQRQGAGRASLLRQNRRGLLRNLCIYIIRSMDVRLKKEEISFNSMKDEKLSDSLIFNIIKKIELRMAMEEKYENARASQLTFLPVQLARLVHSSAAVAYLSVAIGSIVYLRFRRRVSLSVKSLLPHCVIAISINEFEKYRNIKGIDPEQWNEYKSFQRNANTIIAEMKSRVSLAEQLKQLNVITFGKTLQMLKYRPLY